MAGQVTAFIFVGGWGPNELESVLRQAHQAAASDLIDALVETGLVDRVVVATDQAWEGGWGALPVEIDLDEVGPSFHFGSRLADLTSRYGGEHVLYVGGGSAPLMTCENWHTILSRMVNGAGLFVTNNLHSCDWAGFTTTAVPTDLLSGLANDNGLAWSLAEEIGLQVEDLPASAASRFDLDTPADLLVALYHGKTGEALRRFLEQLDWDRSTMQRLVEVMAQEGNGLAIIGRTSSAAWAALEQATKCWIRIFSEERGMRASGRQERGEVGSLISDYLDLAGPGGMFSRLAELVDGVVMDSRVIMAAHGIWPTVSDRFKSDLLRWEEIEDPFLRQFTQAAALADMPILLGGQSCVSGGLLALTEVLSRG